MMGVCKAASPLSASILSPDGTPFLPGPSPPVGVTPQGLGWCFFLLCLPSLQGPDRPHEDAECCTNSNGQEQGLGGRVNDATRGPQVDGK